MPPEEWVSLIRPTTLADAYAGDSLGTIDVLGWSYPLAFSSAVEEHHEVRNCAGLFDFSFMAHFVVRGRDALPFVQRLVTNDAASLSGGSAMYSPICNERGTFVDDCTVIRREPNEYLISTGLERTYDWLVGLRHGYEVSLENRSADLSVLSVQGPVSLGVLTEAGLPDLSRLGYFRAVDVSLRVAPGMVARIGYTGELGYELFVPTEAAVDVWHLIRKAGRHAGLRLCGGLALDSLRIEAGYLMTQVDFDSTVNPIEAGLARFVKLSKVDFIGRDALAAVTVVKRRLRGLRATGGAVPARDAPVRDRRGRVVGRVTRACASPTFGCTLALAYVTMGAGSREELAVDGVPGEAIPIELPFYDPARQRVRAAPAGITETSGGSGRTWTSRRAFGQG